LAAAGCGGDGVEWEPLAPKVTISTDAPGRSMALGRGPGPGGGTAIVLAYEVRGAVHLYEWTAAGVDDWGDIPVGVGPRSVAAVGNEFVTADTTGATLSRVTIDGGLLRAVTGAPIDPPPFHVAPLDASTFAVVLGTGDAAAVQLWSLPPAPAEPGDARLPPVPLGSPVPLPDATLSIFAPRGVVVVRRLAGDVVTLSVGPAGELSVAATTPVCDDPRAATPYDGDVAIACGDGISFLDGSRPRLSYAGNLYDLIAVDVELDGTTDLVGVDLDEFAAAVWDLPDPQARSYPLSRGPIALRAVDLGEDGDEDLIALAFEARAFDILENVVKGEAP
jgi:hypothetical protein